MEIITSCIQGNNAQLINEVYKLYIKDDDIICDITFGKGAFWKGLNKRVFGSDIRGKCEILADFKNLPYKSGVVDVVVFDPPYMHGGKTVKKSINSCYHNENTSHESVIRNYCYGILESERILKKHGRIMVKCQDEIESGKQRLSHVELIQLLEILGFKIIDLFVLMQDHTPTMRENYQKTARKNHSYLIIGELRC